MFYGKYEDDEPSLAEQVAKVLNKRNDDDEVRLTARYCNSDSDGGSYSPRTPSFVDKKSEPREPQVGKEGSVPFSKAKVGDTIQGLEALGKVVSISGPNDPLPEPKLIPEKKISKGRKWLEKKGFDYDGEYQGQHSYWNERMKLSVVTDPKHFILTWDDGLSEEEELFSNLKSLKARVKEIMAIYR